MIWAFSYIAAIVIANVGFATLPLVYGIPPMTLLVGGIFIIRDLAQRKIGHWVLVAMAVGLVLSYLMASPVIAIASAVAFATSEVIDWAIYTRMPEYSLSSRILVSSSLAVPVDSALFMGLAGFLTPAGFAIMVAVKLVSIVLVWIFWK